MDGLVKTLGDPVAVAGIGTVGGGNISGSCCAGQVLLAARNRLCGKTRNKRIFLPCKGCPLDKLREPGMTCRDSVLKHQAEAEELLKTE